MSLRNYTHDNTLGACRWCGSTVHKIFEDHDEPGDVESYWGQCDECGACSPGYPTIEKLREEWTEPERLHRIEAAALELVRVMVSTRAGFKAVVRVTRKLNALRAALGLDYPENQGETP